MAVASRVRPLVVVALLVVVASVLGVLALLRFDRPRDSSLDQPLIAPSATPAPAPSAPRVEQLRGHVVDANGDPVSGAHVRVLAGGKGVAETATDGAGRFAFDRLASGLVRVQADHEPEGAVDSAPITISDAPTELTLVLAPAGIDGVVVDGDNGRPIAGVALSVEGVPFTSPSATTDEAGAFHFAAVPFEATAVVAVASGYRASRAVLGPREDEPVPSLRIVLHAAPAVEGDVVDADGMPIHARIVACEGKPFEAQVESGDDGTFQLPPSTVGCAAFALHADMAPSETVPIAEGRRLTLRLGTPGAIAGFVVDDRGQSVDTFSVGIESFVPAHGFVAPPRGTTAFEDGRFRLEHLVPGTYVLTAVTAGRPPVRSDKVVVRSGATTGGVKLIIARGGAIEGRVLDEDHLPVADVELRFDSVSAVARSDAFTKTDASGRYRLEGAPSGPLTVSAHKDGFTRRSCRARWSAPGRSHPAHRRRRGRRHVARGHDPTPARRAWHRGRNHGRA